MSLKLLLDVATIAHNHNIPRTKEGFLNHLHLLSGDEIETVISILDEIPEDRRDSIQIDKATAREIVSGLCGDLGKKDMRKHIAFLKLGVPISAYGVVLPEWLRDNIDVHLDQIDGVLRLEGKKVEIGILGANQFMALAVLDLV